MIQKITQFLALLYQIKLWIPILIGLVGVWGVGFWTASITNWLNRYGPAGWVLFGLIIVVLCILILFIIGLLSITIMKFILYRNRATNTSAINPIDSVFENKRINLLELSDPVTRTIIGKTFIGCQLVGNSSIFFNDTHFNDGFQTYGCDFISIDGQPGEKLEPNNLVIVNHCIFRKCTFYELVMIFARNQKTAMSQELGIKWLG
jgi:hypothetical protein